MLAVAAADHPTAGAGGRICGAPFGTVGNRQQYTQLVHLLSRLYIYFGVLNITYNKYYL